jgi:coenzyme F420-0:L-glutamate ligase / coenzyme F420-1:gamma-L-glutamate ligase
VTDEDGPGARSLVRVGPDDMFATGSAEAYAQGWKDATDGAADAGPSAS